jgi:adhesin HecA-like repeat protein
MANYTANQLYGAGTPIEALTSGSTYTFTLSTPSSLSGSAYFTNESVRNRDGFYSGSTPNTVGVVDNLNGVSDLIQSDYIFSVIVDQDGGSFDFTPTSNVLVSGSFLRATGGLSLSIT